MKIYSKVPKGDIQIQIAEDPNSKPYTIEKCIFNTSNRYPLIISRKEYRRFKENYIWLLTSNPDSVTIMKGKKDRTYKHIRTIDKKEEDIQLIFPNNPSLNFKTSIFVHNGPDESYFGIPMDCTEFYFISGEKTDRRLPVWCITNSISKISKCETCSTSEKCFGNMETQR